MGSVSDVVPPVTKLIRSTDVLLYLFNKLPPDVFFWKDETGESLVHTLCLSRFSAFKALYQEAGPQLLKEESFTGKTVLHVAAEFGRIELLRFLLEEMDQEDVCKKCKGRGALALHYAVRKKHHQAARMLAAAMPAGMRFEPDFSGYSAVQLAEEIDATGYFENLSGALAINVTKGAM